MSDYTSQAEGQALLIHWSFAAHIWVGKICAYMLFNLVIIIIIISTYSYPNDIIQFRFQANWK